MKVLIGCETSAMTRTAFRELGHDAWSVDLKESVDGSPFHIQSDIRQHLHDSWDLAILHPPCTRLCNSGIQWLATPPHGRTKEQIWDEMLEGAELFADCLASTIPRVAIENPIMHKYAKRVIHGYREPTQSVQLYWFGDKAFKTTNFWLKGLPLLVPTDPLIPPQPGTLEHTYWTREIHNAPAGPGRSEARSRTFPGLAWAMAQQWSTPPKETLK